MTAAGYPMSTSHPPRTAPSGETTPPIARMLRAIYHKQDGGYFELQVIEGDPDTKGNKARTPEDCPRWHQWQPTNPAWWTTFLETIAQLAARYGNVYISRTCYTEPKRSAAYALPSYALFIDDAPAGAYTFTIQTSSKRQQGWTITTEPMSPDTYTDLAKRAAYHDADRSGWDLQQLVRLPGTYNTKQCRNRNQWWPVTIHPADNRTFTLDELRRRWPAVAPVAAPPCTPDDEQVDYYLTNIKLLLNSWGYPKRLKLKSPGVAVIKRRDQVDDRSTARYSVAKSLYLHGYPDAELAALLLHFCDYGQSTEKGSAWLDGDIARILGKLHKDYPDVKQSPTRLDGDVQPAQKRTRCEPERRPAHRPRTKSADELLTFYQRNTAGRDTEHRLAVPMRRKEVAAEFKVSLATLRRLEIELFRRGEALRITPSSRSSSYVVLLKDAEIGTIKSTESAPVGGIFKSTANVLSEQPEYRTPIMQTQTSANPTIGEHTPHECIAPAADVAPVPLSGVCSPRDAAASQAPVLNLGEMVREALDMNGDGLKRKHGATRYRVIAAYLTVNFGRNVAPERLARLVDAEQARRKLAAQDAAYSAWLSDLDGHDLQRQLRAVERSQARAHEADNRPQALMWGHKRRAIAAEYARRGLDPAVKLPRLKRAIPKRALAPLPLLDEHPIESPAPLAGMAQDAPNVPSVVQEPPCAPSVPVMRPMNWMLLARYARERERMTNEPE